MRRFRSVGILRIVVLSCLCLHGGRSTFAELPAADKPVASAENQSFELRVVGPEGKPVSEAAVEIRTKPNPTADDIAVGTFRKKSTYGATATTDKDGRLVVKFAKAPTRFEVNITTPGYGPYWARWSSDARSESVPAHFTAELEAGWSLGGIVVDDAGHPVSGARVHPSIEYKKPPGDNSQLGVGLNLKTDADGRWHFDSVPDSLKEVRVEISSSAFMPLRAVLTRSDVEIPRGGQPTAKIVLDRGLTVTGKVTDDKDNPIAGAVVRTNFLNDVREAKTGDDGVYQLGGCEPKLAKIVVSAKGRATDMQEVAIASDMQPVNFQAKPGGTIKIRVQDENGNPVPKARIFFQRWRTPFYEYFALDNVNGYADENGLWIWNEAPLDEFEADIVRPGGMQLGRQKLVAREEEYVFKVPPALVISGSVVDAETKKPIEKFRVVPGLRFNATQMSWSDRETFTATGGTYKLRETSDYSAYLVKIEADGYTPAQSRDIKTNEGNVTIDFELKKGRDIAGTVLDPDGKPAVGAKVALGIAGAQINIRNGAIDKSQTYATQTETDKEGHFHFPPQSSDFQLVVTHPSGYAHIAGTAESLETIDLNAWANVEGTFRVGKESQPGVTLEIYVTELQSYGEGMPRIFTSYEVTTDKEGKFKFDRVIPGRARIGRRILLMVNEGATEVTSSCRVATILQPGQTTHIDLGGSGRAAVGQLEPPKKFDGKMQWSHVLIDISPVQPNLPAPAQPKIPPEAAGDPAKRAAWLQDWQQTEDGKAWTKWSATMNALDQLRESAPHFKATVATDGKFRIDDMPAGTYQLSARTDAGHPGGKITNFEFTVPQDGDGKTEEPVDLGVLTLEPQHSLLEQQNRPMSKPSEHRDSPTSAAADAPPLRFGLKSILAATAIVAILVAPLSAGGPSWFVVAVNGVLVLAWMEAKLTGQKKLARIYARCCSFGLIFALFVALGISGMTATRQSAMRAQCQDNLKQLGLGLLNYEDKKHTLPPVYISDEHGQPMHSWRMLINPGIDESIICNRYDYNHAWDSPANDRLTQVIFPIFQCLDDSSRGPYDTSYVAIIGPGTAWQADRGTKLSEITDGTSNTILLVEMKNSGIRWSEPRDLDLTHLPPGITPQNLLQSLSNHTGIVNAVFADGHVEGIPDTIPWSDFLALLTIAGGETVDRSKW